MDFKKNYIFSRKNFKKYKNRTKTDTGKLIYIIKVYE